MLTALKIGLLALMPLRVAPNPTYAVIENEEFGIQYTETTNYIHEHLQLSDLGLLVQYNTGYQGGVLMTYEFSDNGSGSITNETTHTEYEYGNYIRFADTDGEGLYIALTISDGVWLYNNEDKGYSSLSDYTLDIEYIQIFQVSNFVASENEGLVNAVEQDIANANMPSISDIFAEVTSAITSFVGSLGQAFNSVTALFYANGNWTFLGVLVLIGVGCGLVYGAYRLIKGLLHRV